MILALGLALGLQVAVGDPAPPVTAAAWLGAAPELEGRAVLVEFWGTWCAPCVASMPHVQDLWSRYRDEGLAVAAISYESLDVLRPWIESRSYTLPVGSDPEKVCIEAFGVRGWPSTFVIGRDGRVLYAGPPMGAEPYVQQALGLQASAAELLSRYVAGGEPAREALQRLASEAPRDFVPGPWAQQQGGEPAPHAPKDVGEALSNVVAGWDGPLRGVALNDLAAADQPCDLRAWAEAELGRRFPIPDEEFLALLDAGRHAEVLDALVLRRPSSKALSRAKSDDALRDWAHERVMAYRENAELLVFLQHWHYGELQGPDEFSLPPGTAVTTVKADGRVVTAGFLLNTGAQLLRADFPAGVQAYLMRVAALSALDRRKPASDLGKAAGKLHDELFDELADRHGKRKRKVRDG